ncbi:MAG: 1-acyl-sn-glycerol-3-phosphate acyltransferase [Myxococcota bacterium]
MMAQLLDRPGPGDAAAAAAAESDPLSAMTPRFNGFVRWFARRYFRHFGLDDKTVRRLQELESLGSVVYVMRYASRLDYFLFNTLFLREGLRLSSFANGIRFYYFRPLLEGLRALFRGRAAARGASEQDRTRQVATELARKGGSFFLFLRTARLRLGGRRQATVEKAELDLLEEVVAGMWDSDRPVHVVPLAIFWRKGPRARRRFLNLLYGAATRPSDLAKVTSFLTTYRNLAVKVGDAIDLSAFIDARRSQGQHDVARMVRRSILTFLYREEKAVEGPTLRPLHQVQEIVISDPKVQEQMRARSAERRVPLTRSRAEAEKMLREIAAHMNSTFLAILNALVGSVTNRLFAQVEITGLEKVAEYAKRHPLVLVPSHRSYFDFLLVSMAFYANYLVPPHIAARENMAFGPFGFLWRRAGAFFLRKSFEDDLYKEVFRSYVGYLVSEGVTQEFFIEGGRSRTGKTLAPRLGILSWEIEAFLGTARRDLFFVPVAISYERLVEEGAMVDELEGGEKTQESMLGLMRARKFLRRRFGSVFMSFGEPISLGAALGDRRQRFAETVGEDVAAEKRAFIAGLGNQIVERINWAMVPNATAVAACALLGERRRGLFRAELVERMQQVVDLLRLQDARLTPALARDEGTFEESITSMLRMDLIKSSDDARGEILYFEESRRRALDFYRNSIVQFLAAPSFLARQLLAGPGGQTLRVELATWLEIFYTEFFTPRGEVLAAHVDAFVDHFERHGWLERVDGEVRATEKGLPSFRFLAEQTRGVVEVYYCTVAAVEAALEDDGLVGLKELRKAAEEQFQRAAILGEVDRREGANPVTFKNARDLLVQRRILEAAADDGGKPREGFARGGAFGDLPALRKRLAGALAAR